VLLHLGSRLQPLTSAEQLAESLSLGVICYADRADRPGTDADLGVSLVGDIMFDVVGDMRGRWLTAP